MEGVGANPPQGRLIEGLNRNVFPAEALCADPEYTRQVVADFLKDALAHGVVGGAAYMTVHPAAARIALEMLPDSWQLGPVLMNMNCPEYLRTDEPTWWRDTEQLARDFGSRLIITDRFAVSVSSPLRRQAAALARKLGLRMQTHLNEQIAEKRFVEEVLYPGRGTYTEIYRDDGLLDCRPILAHCVRMSPAEFDIVQSKSASIAHCPTSNTLLASGTMPLELVQSRGIEYAIYTDVGASPTTSILCEMAQFLKVHAGSPGRASPQEALYRATLAPARMLGLDAEVGSLEIGKAMSFIEIDGDMSDIAACTVDDVVRSQVLELPAVLPAELQSSLKKLQQTGLDAGPELTALERDCRDTVTRLDRKIRRVVIDARAVWERPK